MGAQETVAEFFDALEGKLAKRKGELSGVTGLLQFRVGESARWLRLSGGEAQVGQGEAPSPDCVVTVTEETFADLLDGKLSPTAAFLSGKIRVAGNFGLAMHLGSLVKR
jgi:putative sterol carrier protein